ncbi:MAG: rhodanese-like domain-containing protein [Candidatus Nitrosopolaris sp.]
MTIENASTSKIDTKEDIVKIDENHNFQLPIICDVDTLRVLIKKEQVRVVDVRKAEEYTQEHIPSATSLPLSQLLEKDTPNAILDILQNLGVSDKMPVVIYDDTLGALAARVAWSFQYVGHANTALLEMTFSHWKNVGLETETKINSFPTKKHSLNINHRIHADASYVEAAKEQPNKILVDSRERLNFLTEHIPDAKNIPYTMLGSNGGILRSPEEIKRYIENRGIPVDAEVITYCGSIGTLSGLTYFALKSAGMENVRLYSKSFREWKSLGKPKEEFKDANYWDLSAD